MGTHFLEEQMKLFLFFIDWDTLSLTLLLFDVFVALLVIVNYYSSYSSLAVKIKVVARSETVELNTLLS